MYKNTITTLKNIKIWISIWPFNPKYTFDQLIRSELILFFRRFKAGKTVTVWTVNSPFYWMITFDKMWTSSEHYLFKKQIEGYMTSMMEPKICFFYTFCSKLVYIVLDRISQERKIHGSGCKKVKSRFFKNHGLN